MGVDFTIEVGISLMLSSQIETGEAGPEALPTSPSPACRWSRGQTAAAYPTIDPGYPPSPARYWLPL